MSRGPKGERGPADVIRAAVKIMRIAPAKKRGPYKKTVEPVLTS